MNRLVCVTMTALALIAAGSGCCCMDRYYYGDCALPPCGDAWAASRLRQQLCRRKLYGAGGLRDGRATMAAHGSCGAVPQLPAGLVRLQSLPRDLQCHSLQQWLRRILLRRMDQRSARSLHPCDESKATMSARTGVAPPRWWLGGRGTCGHRCGVDGDCGEGCDSCTDAQKISTAKSASCQRRSLK